MKLDPEVWGTVFPELVGPGETQTRPILGFRINRVQLVQRWWGKPSVVLRSMSPIGYSWQARRNEAMCFRSGQAVPGQPRHRAPATNCTCGLYAVHDVDRLSGFTNLDPDNFVLAGVAGTGIVRVHTEGWRAQFARIVAISVELPEIPVGWTLGNALRTARPPNRSKAAQGRLSARAAEALEAKYQVPVVPLDKLREVMAGAGNFLEEMT